MKPLDTEQFKSRRAVGTGRNRIMAACLLPTQLRFARDAQNPKSTMYLSGTHPTSNILAILYTHNQCKNCLEHLLTC